MEDEPSEGVVELASLINERFFSNASEMTALADEEMDAIVLENGKVINGIVFQEGSEIFARFDVHGR